MCITNNIKNMARSQYFVKLTKEKITTYLVNLSLALKKRVAREIC